MRQYMVAKSLLICCLLVAAPQAFTVWRYTGYWDGDVYKFYPADRVVGTSGGSRFSWIGYNIYAVFWLPPQVPGAINLEFKVNGFDLGEKGELSAGEVTSAFNLAGQEISKAANVFIQSSTSNSTTNITTEPAGGGKLKFARGEKDGTNAVQFVDFQSLKDPDGTDPVAYHELAYGTIWTATPPSLEELQQQGGFRIVECDVLFHTGYVEFSGVGLPTADVGHVKWINGQNKIGRFADNDLGAWGEYGVYLISVDVQGVATHEFGHGLGLGHTNLRETDATMYANMTPFLQNLSQRTLHSDDIHGIKFLYPDEIAGKSNTPRRPILLLENLIPKPKQK